MSRDCTTGHKTGTSRVEDDKFADNSAHLSFDMKKDYLKKVAAFMFVSCTVFAGLSIAQTKQAQPSWFAITIRDRINWLKDPNSDEELKVNDVNWYFKNSCVPEDLIKTLERKNKDLNSRLYYEIQDEVVDESGKAQVVDIIGFTLRSVPVSARRYFRQKSDCLIEQQKLKEEIIKTLNASAEKRLSNRKKYE